MWLAKPKELPTPALRQNFLNLRFQIIFIINNKASKSEVTTFLNKLSSYKFECEWSMLLTYKSYFEYASSTFLHILKLGTLQYKLVLDAHKIVFKTTTTTSTSSSTRTTTATTITLTFDFFVGNNRVRVYSMSGDPLLVIGVKGHGNGQVSISSTFYFQLFLN